jgi:hypothetical protein
LLSSNLPIGMQLLPVLGVSLCRSYIVESTHTACGIGEDKGVAEI